MKYNPSGYDSKKTELLQPKTARWIRIGVLLLHILIIGLPLLIGLWVVEKKQQIISVRPIPSRFLPQPTSGNTKDIQPPKEIPKELPEPPSPSKPVPPTPKPEPKPPKKDPPKVKPDKPIQKVPEKPKDPPKPKNPPKPKDSKPDKPKEIKPKPEPPKPRYAKAADIEISTEIETVKSTKPSRTPPVKVPGPPLPTRNVNLSGIITGPVVVNGNSTTASSQNYDDIVGAYLYDRWNQPNSGQLGGKRPNTVVDIWITESGAISRWNVTQSSGIAPMELSIRTLFNDVRSLPRKETGPFPYKISVTFQVQ